MLSTLVWSQTRNTFPHQLLWRRLSLSQPKQVHYHYLDHTDMPSDSLVSQTNTYLSKRKKVLEGAELLHYLHILLEIQNDWWNVPLHYIFERTVKWKCFIVGKSTQIQEVYNFFLFIWSISISYYHLQNAVL